jgi:hypothetical protein
VQTTLPTSNSTLPVPIAPPACGNGFPVVTHASPAVTRGTLVYLIANPVSRKSAAWPKIHADLTARVKSAILADFSDLFADGADYRARWPQIVGQLGGAVVIPRPLSGGLMLGLAALREANEIDAAGKPVLIYTRRGLFRWAQADVRIHERSLGLFRVELIIPGGAR